MRHVLGLAAACCAILPGGCHRPPSFEPHGYWGAPSGTEISFRSDSQIVYQQHDTAGACGFPGKAGVAAFRIESLPPWGPRYVDRVLHLRAKANTPPDGPEILIDGLYPAEQRGAVLLVGGCVFHRIVEG